MDDSKRGMKLTTGPKVEVTGDAIVNNRKNKLIPSYELEISGSWTGVQYATRQSPPLCQQSSGYTAAVCAVMI